MFQRILFSITIVFFLSACEDPSQSPVPKDLANMVKVFEKADPGLFEEKMKEFVAFAKDGDVEKMLSITSNITKDRMGGGDALKEFYKNDTIPTLKACQPFSGGGNVIFAPKTLHNSGEGWTYQKRCVFGEDKSIMLQFTILKENNVIVVTSVGHAK